MSWKLEFTDSRKRFFLDGLACDGECYALSDPVDGKFVIVATHNYEDWKELPGDGMSAALPGEAAFAASGTSLAVNDDNGMYFGTAGARPRVCFTPQTEGRHGARWKRRSRVAAHRQEYFLSRRLRMR